MLALLKSKKDVVTDIFSPTDKRTIYCSISDFNQNSEGYRVNGSYYYLVDSGNKDTEDKIIYEQKLIKNFSRTFTEDDLDNLYELLSITYPKDSKFTKKSKINILAGLKYIVSIETVLGLVGTDWEEVV